MLSASGVSVSTCRCCNSHCIACLGPECGGLHDHLANVPWRNIFKNDVSAAASELYE